MGYQLTGELLQYCAEHIVACRPHKRKACRALIITDDDQSYGRLQTKLSSLYKATDVVDNSKPSDLDFSLVFDSKTRRNEVVDDINDAIAHYLNAHPETPTSYQPSSSSEDGKDETETQKTDWTTYIIIGAAAAVIIALLWKRK